MSGNSVPNSPPFVIFQHGTQYRPTRCETCGCPASPGRQDMGGHPEEHTLTDSGDRTEHRDEKAGLLGGGGIRPESQGKHIQSRNTPPGVPLVQGASPSPRGSKGSGRNFFASTQPPDPLNPDNGGVFPPRITFVILIGINMNRNSPSSGRNHRNPGRVPKGPYNGNIKQHESLLGRNQKYPESGRQSKIRGQTRQSPHRSSGTDRQRQLPGGCLHLQQHKERRP